MALDIKFGAIPAFNRQETPMKKLSKILTTLILCYYGSAVLAGIILTILIDTGVITP